MALFSSLKAKRLNCFWKPNRVQSVKDKGMGKIIYYYITEAGEEKKKDTGQNCNIFRHKIISIQRHQVLIIVF